MSQSPAPAPSDSLDFAWRVHGALDSWTGKVDSKASIVLAIESAVFGFVVTLSKTGGRFADLAGSDRTWYRAGSVLILVAILLALLVVVPQLNRRQSKRTWRSNMIYFGHLRHWDPDALAEALRQHRTYEDQMARQLVAMSKIAWRKHARLQWSVISLSLGAFCLLLAA